LFAAVLFFGYFTAPAVIGSKPSFKPPQSAPAHEAANHSQRWRYWVDKQFQIPLGMQPQHGARQAIDDRFQRRASARLQPEGCTSAGLLANFAPDLLAKLATIAGIDFQFDQCAIGPKQFDLVEPAAVLGLKFDFHDLAGLFAFDALQNRSQGQHLSRLQLLSAASISAGSPHPGPTEVWFCGPQGLAKNPQTGLQQWRGNYRFYQEAFEMR